MSNGIENFFKTQVTVFDQAVQFEKSLHDDLDRIAENEGSTQGTEYHSFDYYGSDRK